MQKHYQSHKKIKQALLIFGLALVLAVTGFVPTFAKKTTEQQLADSKEAADQLKEQTDAAKQQLDAAKQQENAISDRVDELNDQLDELQQSLTDIDTRISEKNDQIDASTKELKELEQTRQERYEAMKVRIRFMYENSDMSLLDSLIGAGSMSEFLNRVEYFSQVVAYDREQLNSYQELLTSLNEKQEKLEAQKDELVALRQEQTDTQDELVTLIADAREDLTAAGVASNDAEDTLSDLKEQLKVEEQTTEILAAQLEYEEKLEAQKAEEDRLRMEEIRRQEEELAAKRAQEEKEKAQADQTSDTDGSDGSDTTDESGDSDTSVSESDLELMACIIQCEAEGEPYEGKLAVGSVVMNRVASSSFPNTVMGVIYQSGQFSPVASGRMAARLAAGANSECYQAAREVLNGNITVPYLFFRRDNGTIDGYVICHHVFY